MSTPTALKSAHSRVRHSGEGLQTGGLYRKPPSLGKGQKPVFRNNTAKIAQAIKFYRGFVRQPNFS